MGIFVVARLCYVLVRREESFTFIISIVKTMYDRMMLFICVMVDYLPYVFCHRSCYCHWYLEWKLFAPRCNKPDNMSPTGMPLMSSDVLSVDMHVWLDTCLDDCNNFWDVGFILVSENIGQFSSQGKQVFCPYFDWNGTPSIACCNLKHCKLLEA